MTAETTDARVRPACVDCGGTASGMWQDTATGETRPMCDDCAMGGEAPAPAPEHDQGGLTLRFSGTVRERADLREIDPGPAIVLAGAAAGGVVGWFTLGYVGVVAVGLAGMVVSFVVWRHFAVRSLTARGIVQPRFWGGVR